MDYELSAEVEQYVEPFAEVVVDAADAFVVPDVEMVDAPEVEIVGYVDVASEEPAALLPWDADAFATYYYEWLAGVRSGEIEPGTAADPWRIWDVTGEVV